MTDTADRKSNTASVIKKALLPDMTAKEALDELKKLTPEDKEQLASGILDGSMTY